MATEKAEINMWPEAATAPSMARAVMTRATPGFVPGEPRAKLTSYELPGARGGNGWQRGSLSNKTREIIINHHT